MSLDATLMVPAILAILGANLVCLMVLLTSRSPHSTYDTGLAVRAALAEGLASFLLVLVGLLATQHHALAQALALVVLAAAFRPLSAGHGHPAISLGAALNGLVPWSTAVGYIIVQFIGGILAALLAAWIIGTDHFPHVAPVGFPHAALAGALLALAGSRDSPQAPLFAGAALLVASLALAPASNPAAWVGQALLTGQLHNWQACLGPLLGALTLGLLVRYLLQNSTAENSALPSAPLCEPPPRRAA